MNKLLVGLCASICLLSLATDAQAVRLGGRTTIRPHRSYTPPPRTYRPTPANPAIRGFNARQNAASRRSLPGTIRHKSRMTCTSSKQACGNKATNCSFGRFKITVTHLTRSLQRSSSAWTAWQKSTLRLHLPPTPN